MYSAQSGRLTFIHYFLSLDELLPFCNEDNETSNLLEELHHLDSHETTQCQPEERGHHPKVTIPERGGEIYKATLVSLLNEDPKLSHDR